MLVDAGEEFRRAKEVQPEAGDVDEGLPLLR